MSKEDHATVRKNILNYFGAYMRDAACYVRSTETWFGICPDCLMWVRDGHASMEAAVGVWIGRWAGSSGAPIQEVNAALDEYTRELRHVFGVDALEDLEAPYRLGDPYDEAPDHKGHCKPIVFRIGRRQTHRKPVLKLVSDRDHPDLEVSRSPPSQSGAPKRGTGEHIRLTPLGDDQRVAVPGMADFSGGGPVGTYCRDCFHFADKIAVQTGINSIEKTRFGCVIWAQKMAHAAPLPRRDIRLCPSCKHFEKAPDASPRCFIIDSAGTSYKLVSMPKDLKGWLLEKHKRDAR